MSPLGPRRRRQDDTEVALANFALTFAKALLVFLTVLMLLIAPVRLDEPGIRPKAELILMVQWPGDLDHDVDVWVRDPDGLIVYFGNREAGFMALDRDDLGNSSDTAQVNGHSVVVPLNEEIVSFRGIKPGEYIVNLHLFSADRIGAPREIAPFPVEIRLIRINPEVREEWRGVVALRTVRAEVHVLRFNVSADGSVSGIRTDLPAPLMRGAR